MARRRPEKEATLLLSPVAKSEEQFSENALRPRSLEEFIGLKEVKARLEVMMEAARARGGVLEHVLFAGPPGLGKTTLAHIVANEMRSEIRTATGPGIARPGELAALLTSLARGDVLFIDEIHRLPKAVEEVLYPALEDYALDVVMGKGAMAHAVRLRLEPFTLIGATTRPALVSAPLRNRFGHIFRVDFYSVEELAQIVKSAASRLGVELDEDAASEIASRARGTPRVANRLLRRVRDFAQVNGVRRIDKKTATGALEFYGIGPSGLDSTDVAILKALCQTFRGQAVGLSTLAAAVGEEPDSIETVHEPYLMKMGMIVKTTRGRKAAPEAYRYLGMDPPAP